uniref:F-box/LRR-repeat protein 20-like isoform X8 n=1 Tax=Nyctereutes procyonoides TaxID=34880 RepID=UPI00244401BD|nr:F-box/LRR-repeat protein 20-like isoform X8 [Nyctereutes procyonoides]
MPIAQPKTAQLVQQVWSGLHELNLAGLWDLTDLSFSRFRHCAPNLERLSLAYCHLTFELGPAQGSLGPQDFSCSQPSFHNLLQFVKERAGRLCGLDLSGTGLLPKAAKALAQVAGLQLKELSLRACQDLSTGAVAALCRLQSGLTSLDLSGCSELADGALLAISCGLACLQCLRLRKLQRLTDTGCTALGALQELHSLNLAECGRVSGWGLARALGSGRKAPAPFASLSLAYCSSLKVLQFPELRQLSLSLLPALTDKGLVAVARGCPSLERLVLSHCSLLSNEGWSQAASSWPRLQHLNLASCGQLTEQTLDTVGQACKQLRMLDVAMCPRISMAAVRCFQAQLPQAAGNASSCSPGQAWIRRPGPQVGCIWYWGRVDLVPLALPTSHT